jgi:hypothetical protein
MKTNSEQLEDVRQAIAHIETGAQEYELEVSTSGGSKSRRRLRRADLKTLYEREAYLSSLVERESGYGTYIGVPK